MITAKIIADSIANNIRLVTMELNYPRFIHSEVMTHRMFSRNASSSRAIPIEKMIQQVIENPAMPIHWGKNQPGMQAREEIEDIETAKYRWGLTRHYNVIQVENLLNLGTHKQVANRLLEPFQWIKVIVTATEWDNFFKLRLHPDAQPEIQELARCMKKAMEESTPQELKPGEWHIPYVNIRKDLDSYGTILSYKEDKEVMIKCSVARCARVSYNNHDNSSPDIEKDIALADRLLAAGHMSPFEHQATPMSLHQEYWGADLGFDHGTTHKDINGFLWSGNFRGWIQYRQVI